jgi:hypothetical protein
VVRCRESLSELTSAVALSICDDKAMTRRIVAAAGRGRSRRGGGERPGGGEGDAGPARLAVVKPARGEQGRGVAVDLDTIESVERAIEIARAHSDQVLVESYHKGDDLRLIVIGFNLVAAGDPAAA